MSTTNFVNQLLEPNNEDDDIQLISQPTNKASKVLIGSVPELPKCRAPVYQLFVWDDTSRHWKCKLCKSSFQHHKHSGSTVLNVHAKSKHPIQFKNLKGRSVQLNLTSHLVEQKPPPAPVTKDGVWSRVVQFVVETNQPYRVVEHPAFLDLINYVSREHPNAEILKRGAVKDSLAKSYYQEKELLKNELEGNLGKISLIVDCWTSSNQHAFQGVLATWIDNDWKMQVVALDLTMIDGPHTGENLATELGKVITEFGLWKKLMSITTDNAKNMDTMLLKIESLALDNESEFSSVNYRVRCLAHIINLVCKAIIRTLESSSGQSTEFAAMDEFDDTGSGLISKMRSAVNAIRGSPQRRKHFEKICERLKCKHLVLISDVKTRWNSTLDLLLRVREMKEAFTKTCQSVPELARFTFSDLDWLYFDQLIDILNPFKEATVFISKERPTPADTTTVYQLLFTHLEKIY